MRSFLYVLLSFCILSFCFKYDKYDKYVLDFDVQKIELLETERNKTVLQTIKNKYWNEDSISIAVSYPYIVHIFQINSAICRDDILIVLSILLEKPKIKLMKKFDKKSLFDGIFYQKPKKNDK